MSFDPASFKGRKAAVIGLGRSGIACARLLCRKGFKVFGTDSRPRKELAGSLSRMGRGFSWEGGRHTDRALSCAFAVKSPGLSPSLPLLQRMAQRGIPVFSELEVALAFCKAGEVIAITGTNGKTTTTALVAQIFKAGSRPGRKVRVCGNIGLPASAVALETGSKDTVVLEVSSYQLEDSRYFRPNAAALLNITADHLDHHGGMDRYLDAKARVFEDQRPEDLCVFNAGDPLTLKISRDCGSRRLFFGPKGGPAHAWVEKGMIRVSGVTRRPLSLRPPKLPGAHNLENSMAAALLALGRGVKPAAVQKAFRSFKGVEHRLEEVGVIRGLRCVNDSKATNVDSTLVALKALEDEKGRILLILGGLHKGSPYSPLRPLVAERVKGIFTIGSAARKIEEDLSGSTSIFPCGELKIAIETAFQIGSPGDLLLLSPACASFDQFKDFEDRGRRFKELVSAQVRSRLKP
ncbi:MAG: UDP-N-acetylmuramoyl-L-alanine--D-glutamate ligase [Elusimicrobia bacterium]|nr:UDP-N-acetylmuramoyl-L-alanine--D-glutamate ligase [Elusimicrobiota bacterium]